MNLFHRHKQEKYSGDSMDILEENFKNLEALLEALAERLDMRAQQLRDEAAAGRASVKSLSPPNSKRYPLTRDGIKRCLEDQERDSVSWPPRPPEPPDLPIPSSVEEGRESRSLTDEEIMELMDRKINGLQERVAAWMDSLRNEVKSLQQWRIWQVERTQELLRRVQHLETVQPLQQHTMEEEPSGAMPMTTMEAGLDADSSPMLTVTISIHPKTQPLPPLSQDPNGNVALD
jgi:hypothetical protein